MILKVRSTGGFNGDWDTTYALSLFSEVAIERSGRRRRGPEGEERSLADWSATLPRRTGLRAASRSTAFLGIGLESKSVKSSRVFSASRGIP